MAGGGGGLDVINPVVKNRPLVLFGVGAVLLTLMAAATFLDTALNNCALPGRTIGYEDCGPMVRGHFGVMSTALAPIAFFSIAVPTLFVGLATWRRVGGTRLFERTDGPMTRRVTTNILTGLVLLPLGFVTLQGIWFSIAAIAGLPSATGGQFYTDRDLVRGPVQVRPIVSTFIISWVLALRAIALSEARSSR
jgi:hypothetical protein